MTDLARLIDPADIVIAGISADPAKHGARVLAHLRRLGYEGRIRGVNPNLPVIEGIEVHASVAELPQPPDLLIAAVPATAVTGVVEECAGVGGVIVFASGFAETGAGGRRVESELAERAAAVGTRLLGPNSGGVIRPHRGLAASFLTCLDRPGDQIRSGPIAVVTQSGGTGSYLHNLAASRSEGIAISVSTGNEADIKLGEALEAVAQLDEVEVILAVVETVRDGVVFADSVRTAHARGKQVVVCPLGSGARSSALMASHTGALAIPEAVSRGVFQSLGVVTAETPAEAYDVAAILARSGRSKGARVGVVTHSGGIAILLSDLAERSGLTLDDPSPVLGAAIQTSLDHGSAANPLDMGGIIGGPGRFADVVREFADSGEYDVVLAVSTAHPPTHTEERARALAALDTRAPIVHLWMAGDLGADGLVELRSAGLPVTEEPRAAIRALSGLTGFGADSTMPEPISGSPDGWGLPSNSGTVVSTPAAALDAAAGMGYPVVAKLESAEVAHKTDIGGVFLDLRDSGELDRALGELMDLAGELGWPDARVRVQRYRPGLEMIVGGLRHDSFGPMVSVGLGGVFAEIVGDVVFALAPVSPDGARDMIERLGARGLLDGYRGSPAADVEALAQLISLVSRGMAGSEVSTFEINPLIWDGSEWVVVDWLVE